MSVKSYDDYRRIGMAKRLDKCKCGLNKLKMNPTCCQCKEKSQSKRRVKQEEKKASCQNPTCPARPMHLQYERKDMVEYKRFVFCTKICQKEFKKANL